ncbi:MAG: hypothetical protein IPL61_17545 [Myxococcales bacterium]|nr:hypothetical protein [Myxococcales bacterium]
MISARVRAVGLVTVAVTMIACGDDGGGPPASCLPGCPGGRGYDAVAYTLRGTVDLDAGTLAASEDVALIAVATPVVELDAEVAIGAVHAGDRALAYAVDDVAHTLRVDLGPILVDGAATFTVDYVAAPSDALRVAGPRDDDPVTSRVMYTDSEPDRGLRWLVANHDPADRATFAVELTVPAGDDVIANGARTGDRVDGAARVIGHALAQPIPTYLMAFAAGELEHVERAGGRVPLALWFRRGLALVPDDNLDVVARAMTSFEALIGPYPWDRYAVVLLPQFGGGMENATITFNAETSGQGVIGVNLNAHELAHQWFGDWVTMRTYDDVWVKEGMATFLAVEADRAARDAAGTGRRFGTDCSFDPGDAVVDVALTGLDKYNSGPYERAAWVMTQIRDRIGDDAFWAGARKVLADHALGTIDGEGFVRSFAPALDEATIARVLASLPQHGAPTLTVAAVSTGAGAELTLALDDPGAVLIAPIELGAVDAAGVAGPVVGLTAAAPVTVVVPTGGYFAPDQRGVHPYWPAVFGVVDPYYLELEPRMAPGPGAALTAFTAGAPAHQERALDGDLPVSLPDDFTALYDALDSTEARRNAAVGGCAVLAGLTAGDAMAFAEALTPALRDPAIERYETAYARCGALVPRLLFGPELTALAAAPSAATAARLDYLMGFDYGPAMSLAQIGAVATTAPSLRLRDRALSRLVGHTVGRYSPLAGGDVDAWRAFFRGRYPSTTSLGRLLTVWRTSVRLGDEAAVPAVAPLVRSVPMAPAYQIEIVCAAHDLAAPATWTAFQQALQPASTLPAEVAAVLADPTGCPAFRAAPRRDDALDDDLADHVRHLARDR